MSTLLVLINQLSDGFLHELELSLLWVHKIVATQGSHLQKQRTSLHIEVLRDPEFSVKLSASARHLLL